MSMEVTPLEITSLKEIWSGVVTLVSPELRSYTLFTFVPLRSASALTDHKETGEGMTINKNREKKTSGTNGNEG